jgi:hypothetical protein
MPTATFLDIHTVGALPVALDTSLNSFNSFYEMLQNLHGWPDFLHGGPARLSLAPQHTGRVHASSGITLTCWLRHVLTTDL